MLREASALGNHTIDPIMTVLRSNWIAGRKF